MSQSEEERFRELYRSHRGAITAYVRRRAPAEAVEDIVADTFLVCWRRRDRVPPDALPWLYAVALRTAANHRRKQAHASPTGVPSDTPAFAPRLSAGDPMLADAFAALSERDREVLCLVAWEDLPLHQAAKVLQCSPVAARVRFHRARRRLAERLAEAEPNASAPQPLPEGATR
jgi:RNA polymerase sigma-70 factor (ECF subfamily)